MLSIIMCLQIINIEKITTFLYFILYMNIIEYM